MLRRVWQRITQPKPNNKNTRDGWDESYRSGYWDRLQSLDEAAHTAIVAGYCNAIQQPREVNILDIGCGEGLLLKFLDLSKGQRYLGIDISEVAIARAAAMSSGSVRFEVMNIEDEKLAEKYSMIVINECAYYFKDLLSVTKTLMLSVKDDGYLVVSMYISRQTEKLWDVFAAELKTVDLVEIKNIKGTRWKVALFCKN